MIGVLASSQTMRGIANRRPYRYPKPNVLQTIFCPHPKALNLIHFHTRDEALLHDDLRYACALAGSHLHGFQLNMAWPDPQVLSLIREEFPAVIVLQVGEAGA